MRRSLLAMALLASAAGCITNRIGPNLLRKDWEEPRRNPDPTADVTEPENVNPFLPEKEERIAGPDEVQPAASPPSSKPPGVAEDLAKRGAASFLGWFAADWPVLFTYSGTFEEDPNARAKQRQQQEAAAKQKP